MLSYTTGNGNGGVLKDGSGTNNRNNSINNSNNSNNNNNNSNSNSNNPPPPPPQPQLWKLGTRYHQGDIVRVPMKSHTTEEAIEESNGISTSSNSKTSSSSNSTTKTMKSTNQQATVTVSTPSSSSSSSSSNNHTNQHMSSKYSYYQLVSSDSCISETQIQISMLQTNDENFPLNSLLWCYCNPCLACIMTTKEKLSVRPDVTSDTNSNPSVNQCNMIYTIFEWDRGSPMKSVVLKYLLFSISIVAMLLAFCGLFQSKVCTVLAV